MINDCKLRVTVKHEKLFTDNLAVKGWNEEREGYFTKKFGSSQAEIHLKIMPFTGQTYFSVYVEDAETLTKHRIYEICNEIEEMEQPSRS